MVNFRNRFPARRRFLKQSAALTASASIAAPVMALASAQTPEEPAKVRDGESDSRVFAQAARANRRRPD